MHPIVFVVLGAILGSLVTLYFNRRRPAGILRGTTADEGEGPSLIIELYDDVSAFMYKNYITLEVDVRPIISRK